MRRPLTASQRRALAANVRRGDRSSRLLAGDECPIELVACPDEELIYGLGAEGHLTADEARRLSAMLLELADHVEFGPGEWRGGAWEPERRVPEAAR